MPKAKLRFTSPFHWDTYRHLSLSPIPKGKNSPSPRTSYVMCRIQYKVKMQDLLLKC